MFRSIDHPQGARIVPCSDVAGYAATSLINITPYSQF